jgi:YegS/Rv2252/BmrU family lipid kinase
MKRIFIVNETSGNGKSKKVVPNIEKYCKEENIDFEIRYITKQKSGYKIALEYKDEENIIYVVGGDGTLTRILGAIVGTKNKLGIIPAGSGNDTYRTIKNMKKGDNIIDLGKINNTYFINVACTGIDAEVGNNMDKMRNKLIPTSQRYNASLIYTFLKFKFKNVKIKMEAKNIDSKYTILSICNGCFYGGGYNIGPKSLLTDGLLDVYYAEKMPKIAMIPLILKLKKGKHEGKRRIHKYRTKHTELEFKEKIVFNVDGEKLFGKKFKVEVIPKAITIYNDDKFVEKIMDM